MPYLDVIDRSFGQFDAAALKEKGLELRESYVNADPFPHIVIDDFLPEAVLERCLEQFPGAPDPDSRSFDRAQERYKTSYNPDFLKGEARALFYSLNSRPFVQFLENLTGIKGLIPDPYFLGGGFHQTTNGGHLSVHADFNLHPALRLERRLNVLVYLNRDWDIGYGGALELWDQKMQRCVKKVAPEFGRCVVFSTNATSYHGHPDPVAHPQGQPRRSIALYYYTATFDETARSYTTQFKRRPKTADAVDLEVKSRELMRDLLPPILYRNIRRLSNKLTRQPN